MTPTPAQVERLYTEHAGLIHRRCRRILRDDEAASDAVQEVFARAIRHWASWDGTASRLTWLSRIATNHCLNELRNRQGRRSKLDQRKGERPGAGSGPAGPQQLELLDLVQVVMDDMQPELRQLAVLYYFEDMTQREIAAEVGLSVPTVRKRLRQFLHQARRELQTQFPDLVLKEALL